MSSAFSALSVSAEPETVAVPGARVESVARPSSVEEVSEVIRAAVSGHQGLLVCGGRTRLDWANAARPLALGLSTASLSGIDEFVPDEGVVHVKAGTELSLVRAAVEQEGWELPLDSPGQTSTVGGTIASAVTGPRAHAFGSVSDAILGLDVVGGDGVASKCGGRVVKNVTGYDLAKLYCGSFGSLAVVTGAWLRLRPLAATIRAYLVSVGKDAETFERIRGQAGLTSLRALTWTEAPGQDSARVLFELGGSAEGVRHDHGTLAASFELEEVDPEEMNRVRDARAGELAEGDTLAMRVRVLGSKSEAMREALLQAGLRVTIDLGLGSFDVRGRLESPGALESLRSLAEASGGFATYSQIPDAWQPEVEVFGALGGSEILMATLKEKFDPACILNPGRFVTPDTGRAEA